MSASRLKDYAAIIVTDGKNDLAPVMASLDIGFHEVVVWDNTAMPNLSVFGRYAAIFAGTNSEYIYVQDDDCIVDEEMIDYLTEEYFDEGIACNMPEEHRAGEPQALVGWGAVFHWSLPEQAFRRWRRAGGRQDEVFQRCCDIVFTVLTPFERFDLGHENLPYAHAPGRMHLTPGYHEERDEILKQALAIRELH